MTQVTQLSPLGSTAQKLLDAAQDLIQQKGYNGFSYEDLSQIVGIKKPSVHHHFPKKEDLGAQVIVRYTDRFETRLIEIEKASTCMETRLRAYVSLFADTYGQARKLCPCGILGAESSALPASVASAVRAFFHLNTEWLTRQLEAGEEQGTFKLSENASTHAYFMLSALEGAMVVGRGSCSTDPFTSVARILIDRLLMSSAKRPG